MGSGSAAVIDGYAGEREVLNAKEQVDYEGVMQLKMRCLRDLFKCCGQETLQSAGYKEFCSANQYWLLPYSVFCVLRDAHGSAEFGDWSELNVYDAAAVQAYAQQHEQEVSWHHYLQYHASCQLLQARELAHHNGVMLKGDLPIGISGRSVDAWMHAPLFHLDMQAGAPPDPFSAIGQNWGFPTYNWEVMRADGYRWWRERFGYMQQYFDAMRIDHILGFFRMWSIPQGAIWGLLGQFSPALPLSEQELKDYGIELDLERYLKPYITAGRLVEEFEDGAPGVAERFLQQRGDWNYEFLPAFATQQQMQNYLAGAGAGLYSADEQMRLMRLYTEVLLIADTERSGYYHPRIDLHKSFSFKSLDVNLKQAFQRLHDDFYYARHETFWRESALSKLPSLLHSTEMLMCGEDLGMLPACVAPVMAQLQLLTLEIERMPKQMGYLFVDAQTTPYLSVFSTGTHDMSTLRGWWCEDRTLTEQYYKMVLHGEGKAPKELTPSVAEAIVEHALKSHSMLVIVPLQDYLAMDGVGGSMADAGERINDPANANQVWCYRMPISLEELNGHLFFDEQLRKMVTESGR